MWTSADSYCERLWGRYQRALELIEKFKDSPVEEINFLANYTKELLDDYFETDKKAHDYFDIICKLCSERNDFYHYSKKLEETALSLAKRYNDVYIKIINNTKDKYLSKDYDEIYEKYRKIISFDIKKW